MSILKIARMGHPILRERANEIADPQQAQIQTLVQHMLDTMIDANGLGLAAPQVHVSKRLVIFSITEEQAEYYDCEIMPLSVLINPVLEPLSDDTNTDWEGCLSVPGLRGRVPRYDHIGYRSISLEGKVCEREARGWHARVVQHECDHLDGILYPQRIENLSDLIFESEIKHHIGSPDDNEVARK